MFRHYCEHPDCPGHVKSWERCSHMAVTGAGPAARGMPGRPDGPGGPCGCAAIHVPPARPWRGNVRR
jgi:hypothetical protein